MKFKLKLKKEDEEVLTEDKLKNKKVKLETDTR